MLASRSPRVPTSPRLLTGLTASALLACAPRHATPSTADVQLGDSLAVEIIAARHLLQPYADLPIEIHPAFADSVSAPGWPRDAHRDSARTRAIAHALGGTVSPARREDREQVAVVLLSEPRFRSDTATITGTIRWYRDATPRSGHGYETSALTLIRGDPWRVIRVTDLGRT